MAGVTYDSLWPGTLTIISAACYVKVCKVRSSPPGFQTTFNNPCSQFRQENNRAADRSFINSRLTKPQTQKVDRGKAVLVRKTGKKNRTPINISVEKMGVLFFPEGYKHLKLTTLIKTTFFINYIVFRTKLVLEVVII